MLPIAVGTSLTASVSGVHETPVVHEPRAMQADPPSEPSTRTTALPVGTRKTGQPAPEMPRTSNQTRRLVVPGRRSGNRIVEELRALDERFENPRCSICGGEAQLAINNEGPVGVCTNHRCKKIERIDVQTLQRLQIASVSRVTSEKITEI